MKRRWTRRNRKPEAKAEHRVAEQLSLLAGDDNEREAQSQKEVNAAEERPEEKARFVNHMPNQIG